MKKVFIDIQRLMGVSVISGQRNGRMITANGKTVVRLEVQGLPAPILRSEAQFLQDLRNSFLIGDDITSLQDERVREVLLDIQQDSTVSGHVEYVPAGTTFVVTAESSIGKGSPEKVGTTHIQKQDVCNCPTGQFLTFRKSLELRRMDKEVNAMALLSKFRNAGTFVPVQAAVVQPEAVVTPATPATPAEVAASAASAEVAEVAEAPAATAGEQQP